MPTKTRQRICSSFVILVRNYDNFDNMETVEVLEPLFEFLTTDRPFPEVSRLTVVSRKWRTVTLKTLKTVSHLILVGLQSSYGTEMCVSDSFT